MLARKDWKETGGSGVNLEGNSLSNPEENAMFNGKIDVVAWKRNGRETDESSPDDAFFQHCSVLSYEVHVDFPRLPPVLVVI